MEEQYRNTKIEDSYTILEIVKGCTEEGVLFPEANSWAESFGRNGKY